MVPSYETMGDWLDELSQEFPDAFFEDLDGGIQLEREALPDPEFPPGEMYILGEYCDDQMGRYILLYYGSFAALAAKEEWTEADWEEELCATLTHEFTHHIEGLAGERGLDLKDEAFLDAWRDGRERE